MNVNRLVLLNNDGTIASGFSIGTGFGGNGNQSAISALDVQLNGQIVCVGNFLTYDGNSVGRICRLNSDGTFDSDFNTNAGNGFNDVPRTIKIQTDQKILVGGWFNTYNDINANYFIRLNSDGTIDETFNVGGSGFNSYVEAITIESDGKIVCYGNFTTYNGDIYNRIIRLNIDGSSNTSTEIIYTGNPLQIEVSIYVNPEMGSRVITIPHLDLYNHNYKINYGDGTESLIVTSWDDPNCTHSYTTSGVYIISLTGVCETFFVNGGLIAPFITDIKSWGNVGLKVVNFDSCTSLKSIPNDTYSGLTNVTSFQNSFYSCSTLTSLPNGLFKDLTNVTRFDGTFAWCTSLTTIGDSVFEGCINVNDFSGIFINCPLTTIGNSVFKNCTSISDFNNTFSYFAQLTSIGDGLFEGCTMVTSFNYTFEGCELLTSIGNNIFDGCTTVTSFNNTFAGCTGGIIIPNSLFTNVSSVLSFNSTFYGSGSFIIPDGLFSGLTNVTDFSNCFYGCSIDSTGNDLFKGCTSVISFSNVFGNCIYLTTIGTDIFDGCVNVNDFSNAFNSDILLINEAPDLWITNSSATGTDCFINCTGLTNYPYIPVPWGGLGEVDPIFRIELNISSGETITIPHLFDDGKMEYTYDYTVNYGDGTSIYISSWDDTGCTHTYTNAGKYILSILGTCESFYVSGGTISTSITKIKSWGTIGLQEFNFPNCVNLTTISTDTYSGLTSVNNFANIFNGCTSLISIPSDIIISFSMSTNFTNAFKDCTSLTGNAPEWWLINPEPIGTDCFSGCTGLTNYPYIPIPWGGILIPVYGLILEITTTENNQEITIPHLDGYVYDYTVDYGDGTVLPVTSYNDVNCTHIYSTIGVYTLSMNGKYETFYIGGGGTMMNTISKVIQWGSANLKIVNFNSCGNLTTIDTDVYSGFTNVINFDSTFSSCVNLTNIPTDLFRFATGVTTNAFYNTFVNCTSLTSIPTDLFRYNTEVSNYGFLQTFTICTSLTSIPTDLFRYNTLVSMQGFLGTFYGCTSLTSIPDDLFRYNTLVTDQAFGSTFYGCTGITSIPTDLFRYNTLVTDSGFMSTFYGCTSLTSIPTDLFRYNTEVSNYGFVRTFYECSNLTSIPMDLFRYNVNLYLGFHTTFYGCTGLTSIPDDLFKYNNQYNNFYQVFANCTSLTTIGNNVFDGCNGDFSEIFYGCISLVNLPAELFRYATVSRFESTFANCTSLTSIPTDFFRYNTSADRFNGAFYGCVGLTSIPNNIFDYNTQVGSYGFNGTFYGCTSLISIPTDLFRYNTSVSNQGFHSTFYGCTGLTSIPTDLFRYNTSVSNQGFYNVFANCSSLTGITIDLFRYNTMVSNDGFRGSFYNCVSLTSIPTDLFRYNTLVSTNGFYQTFYNCSNLETVPQLLFKYNTNVTTNGFYQTFMGCTKLQLNPWIFYASGETGTRFLNMVSNFTDCFTRTSSGITASGGTAPDLWNCNFGAQTPVRTRCYSGGGNSTVSLTNYASIPTVWKT